MNELDDELYQTYRKVARFNGVPGHLYYARVKFRDWEYEDAAKLPSGSRRPKKRADDRTTDHLRGHPIEHNGKEWVYSDTKESTVKTHQVRPCGHCGEHNTSDGHDACLGTLPDVINACCGHGHRKEAYVQFEDGSILRGIGAEEVFKKLKE